MTKKLSEFGTDGSGNLELTSAAAKLKLPRTNDPATPTIELGGSGEGIYSSTDGSLDFAVSAVKRMWLWAGGMYFSVGPFIENSAATATNPVFIPQRADPATGIGGASGEVSVITGSTEAINVDANQRATMQSFFSLGTPTELTISGGVVTATRSYHTIDTEADAATDDLDTISGGSAGDVLILSPAASARDTTVKDGTGNIQAAGDCVFTTLNDTMTLIHNGSNWLEISRSING